MSTKSSKVAIKDLVFTILTRESPLKIIHITNLIRKRYGRSVTFQGVRKAILELTELQILTHQNATYAISKAWVKENKQKADELYDIVHNNKKIQDDELFTSEFDSLNDLMKYWQKFMQNWISKFKKGDANINCYQGAHAWEGLLHLEKEQALMSKLKSKKIKSYTLSMGTTKLDHQIWKFYAQLGVKTLFLPPESAFDKSYYVGTYGDWILQTIYPDSLVKELENFFRKTTMDDLNLNELVKIVSKKRKMKLIVMKNKGMVKQINNSIISQIK